MKFCTIKRLAMVIACWALVIFIVHAAAAQDTGRNAAERVSDTAQIKHDKEVLERDKGELDAFARHLAAFDAASNANDQTAMDAARALLISDMRREVEQAQARVKQAQAETQQSSRELRSERGDVREDREEVDDRNLLRRKEEAEDDLVRDQVQRGDDRRDRRDDIGDQKAAQARAENQAKILAAVTAVELLAIDDETAFTHERGLMQKFVDLLKADLEATQKEVQEDTRERREDRRESRHDRQKKSRRG